MIQNELNGLMRSSRRRRRRVFDRSTRRLGPMRPLSVPVERRSPDRQRNRSPRDAGRDGTSGEALMRALTERTAALVVILTEGLPRRARLLQARGGGVSAKIPCWPVEAVDTTGPETRSRATPCALWWRRPRTAIRKRRRSSRCASPFFRRRSPSRSPAPGRSRPAPKWRLKPKSAASSSEALRRLSLFRTRMAVSPKGLTAIHIGRRIPPDHRLGRSPPPLG